MGEKKASTIKLQEKQIENLKDENDSLTKALSNSNALSGPVEAVPVNFGNTSVQSAYVEIIKQPAQTIKIYGQPSQWTDEQISKIAAFTRLQEAGLVKVEHPTSSATTVASTSAAFTILPFVKTDKKTD